MCVPNSHVLSPPPSCVNAHLVWIVLRELVADDKGLVTARDAVSKAVLQLRVKLAEDAVVRASAEPRNTARGAAPAEHKHVLLSLDNVVQKPLLGHGLEALQTCGSRTHHQSSGAMSRTCTECKKCVCVCCVGVAESAGDRIGQSVKGKMKRINQKKKKKKHASKERFFSGGGVSYET